MSEMTAPARSSTAGTAGDGYRAARVPHPWDPIAPDPGARARCRLCDSPRTDHPSAIIPTPRRAT